VTPTPPTCPSTLTSSTPSSPFVSTAHTPTHIFTLSLHDALPILNNVQAEHQHCAFSTTDKVTAFPSHGQVLLHPDSPGSLVSLRSEEHTSELQSRFDLVCRLLLEKKKHTYTTKPPTGPQIIQLAG